MFTVAAQQELILIGIHVDPDEAVAENDALMDVHSAVEHKWRTDNILIMGDLNADCNYVRNPPALALRTDPRFLWLIGDDVDTTTKSTDCAYDRCVKSICSKCFCEILLLYCRLTLQLVFSVYLCSYGVVAFYLVLLYDFT